VLNKPIETHKPVIPKGGVLHSSFLYLFVLPGAQRAAEFLLKIISESDLNQTSDHYLGLRASVTYSISYW